MSEEDNNGDAIDHEWVVANVPDVQVVTDLEGVCQYVSPRCREILAWEPSELLGRRLDEFVHPEDAPGPHPSPDELRSDEPAALRFRFRCRDGSFRWVESMSLLVESGDSSLILSSIRDVADRHAIDTEMQLRALTDPLTGVANRTGLMDRLGQGLRRLERDGGVLGLLYVDLDRFKVINDALGHRQGDRILRQMAERLTDHIRGVDTVARLGGDEFVVLIERAYSTEDVHALADRVLEIARRPFVVGDQRFACTMSVGVVTTDDPNTDPGELIHQTDLAMYRAKERGRNRVEVFDDSLWDRAHHRLAAERLLRQAIDENRIVVEYQPIIELRDGHCVGAEALVRVGDPERGLVPPAEFLQAAEETGLVVEIDEHVLRDALRRAAEWTSQFGESGFAGVTVNVTAHHLSSTSFVESVLDQCAAVGLDPSGLTVEFTEQALIRSTGSAFAALGALREAGVSVGLDDFGTGYSSLSYLRQFPLDFVKIDGTFIADLEHSTSARAVVDAIVGLAHALGLRVVAEGVETAGQRDALRLLGCDHAQGYLFARAGEPAAVSAVLRDGSTSP